MTTFRQPARSGYLPPEVVPMLDVAALVASTEETRPILTQVLWEGLKDSTRVVATDTCRVFMARVRRHSLGTSRDGVDVVDISYWPPWRDCVPEPTGLAWEVNVGLAELARRVAKVHGAYHRGGESCRSWWYLDGETLIIMPDLHLRDRHWDSRWVGAAIKGAVLQQSADAIIVLDLELLHDVLERLAGYCPDATATIRVWGKLQPMQIVVSPHGDRLETWVLVMPQEWTAVELDAICDWAAEMYWADARQSKREQEEEPVTLAGATQRMEAEGIPAEEVSGYLHKAADGLGIGGEPAEWGDQELRAVCERAIDIYRSFRADAEAGRDE